MKKITLIMSAVLVALTLNAQELRLNGYQFRTDNFTPQLSSVTLEKGNAALESQAAASLRKAPAAVAQTASTSNIYAVAAEQTGMSVGSFLWLASTDTLWSAQRFAVQIYPMINDSTLDDRLAFFNQSASVFKPIPYNADSTIYLLSYSTDVLLYYVKSGYGTANEDGYAKYVYGSYSNNLIPGKYYIYIRGNNGSAYTDGGKGVVLNIRSFDITGFELQIDEAKEEATIKWDELTNLPENYFYSLTISSGAETVYSNSESFAVDSIANDTIHSPFTFKLQKNTTYNIFLRMSELYNGTVYLGCNNYIDTTFTFGIDYYEPKNLQANVLTGELAGYVELSWEVDSASYAYYIALYDETGTAVSFGNNRNYLITYNLKDTIGLGAGAYNWVVAGLELGSDGYLNFSTDQIAGPAFTMPDVRAPQLVNAAATLSADFTEAVITVMSADDGTAQEDIVIELQDAEGSKVSLFTYISGYNYADTLTNLEQNKEYTYYISAKDQAGNQTAKADRLVVSFTTADVKAPTLLAPTTSDITANSVKISVRATDNVSKDKLTIVVANDSIGNDTIGSLALESTMKYSGVIKGLTPETTYNLWVIAYDEAGNATAKAVPEFKTLAEEKTNENPVIGEISVQTTDTSAVVTIAITDDNTSLADLNVVILDSTMAEIAYPELQATAPLFVATIGGLEPETEYSFVVYAYDTDQGYASKEFSFTTNPTTGLFDLRQDKHAVKVIENGQIYILRDGEKFNVLGAKVEK